MIKECTVQKIAGVSLKIVNRLPEEIYRKVANVIIAFESAKGEKSYEMWAKVDAILDFIAGGHMGRVYDLGDYVLKVNNPSRQKQYNNRDGYILEQLQGIPMIPTLYAYSEDNTFMVVQKIKGKTVREIYEDGFTPSQWDYNQQKKLLQEAQEEMDKRGWVMADMHWGNSMIDENGNMWLVDVGLFHESDKEEWGYSYPEAVMTLNKAHRILAPKKKKEVEHFALAYIGKRMVSCNLSKDIYF